MESSWFQRKWSTVTVPLMLRPTLMRFTMTALMLRMSSRD